MSMDCYEGIEKRAPFDDSCVCTRLLSFKIIEDLNKLYENKIQIIERLIPVDFEVEILLLKKWVNDLMMQNILLMQAVEELEKKVSEQIELRKLLEGKSLKMDCHCSKLLAENAKLKKRLILEKEDHPNNIVALNRKELIVEKEHSADLIELRKQYENELHKKDLELICWQKKCFSLQEESESGQLQNQFNGGIIKEMRKQLKLTSPERSNKSKKTFMNTTIYSNDTSAPLGGQQIIIKQISPE